MTLRWAFRSEAQMPAARPAFSDEKTKYGVGTKKIVVKISLTQKRKVFSLA